MLFGPFAVRSFALLVSWSLFFCLVFFFFPLLLGLDFSTHVAVCSETVGMGSCTYIYVCNYVLCIMY